LPQPIGGLLRAQIDHSADDMGPHAVYLQRSARACDVSKAGVIMLTRSLANDYGPQGVRANCVCPGWVRTPMGDDGMQEVAEKWGCSLEDAYWLCAGHAVASAGLRRARRVLAK
jgi:NAD(P)-dependent dehydrogenase (short-subunit alcohol dehydrogenase family)